ncbi:MAG: peptide chain release factor N(5)-glutamine methyltransferase [Betaproteobacteria bacterium]|nr:peptide chain release factor N(5)-glutamine methyltransferase [Betaproteobacteria bacterium]NBY32771.1 peptide chain release factor N(5)-glutamine methyltransferase [Betaproteobacteria bacterium]
MNIAQALAHAKTLGLDHLEAQTLLLHALGLDLHDRAWLLLHDRDELSLGMLEAFNALVQRRLHNEPIAYLTGSQDFHGLNLAVDPRVLVPRPDTETLVDWALSLDLEQAKVLDLGTGSGAIALALKHAHPSWVLSAVDASADALAVAQANAQALGLAVHFHHGHWLKGLQGRFDLIVSNPPYIAEGDPHLPALHAEPRQGLVSGVDGLDDIRHIIEQAPEHLNAGAWLLLEHGFDQAPAVQDLLRQTGFSQVQSRVDLAGIKRCSGGQWPEVK